MFKEQLEILKHIPENHCSEKKFICPECGNESIEYRYVGSPITHIGCLDQATTLSNEEHWKAARKLTKEHITAKRAKGEKVPVERLQF